MAKNKDLVKQAKKEKQEQKALKKQSKGEAGEESILNIIKALDDGNGDGAGDSMLDRPTARASCTLLSSKNGLIMFGGEYYDTKQCEVFNDVFKWHPGKENEWKKGARVTGRKGPKPRVGHASCVYNDDVYVLGGEFATVNQFYHFKDFWRLDTKNLTWTEICASNGPCGRSGHRTVVVRNQILCFGGFQDNGRETKYFADLYAYSPASNTWKKLSVSKNQPCSRSASVVAANNEGLLVSGGFSEVKHTERESKGVFHEDMFYLDLTLLFDPASGASQLGWTKLKKRALIRAGAAYCQHKNVVYTFGGVVDNDSGGNTYNNSFFFNDVWTIDMGSKQWTRLKIVDASLPEGDGQNAGIGQPLVCYRTTKSGLEKVLLDIDLLKKLEAESEAKKGVESTKDKKRTAKQQPTESDDGVLKNAGILKRYRSVSLMSDHRRSQPLPRSNASVVVKDGYLVIFGGNIELGNSRNVVFDDAWKLNLRTLVWELISPGTFTCPAAAKDGESSDSESSDSESDDSMADESDDSMGDASSMEDSDAEDLEASETAAGDDGSVAAGSVDASCL